jgi:hypothetical protein
MASSLTVPGRLSFVVPFISQELSKDWEFQNRLLRRTVNSILNQDIADFMVVIVGHDKPVFVIDDSRIHWVPVDFPLILSGLDPRETNNADLEVKWTDRGRKLFKGVEYSKMLGATHVLPVDSDDLVSRRLAALPIVEPDNSGWLIWSGYRYFQGAHSLRYKPKRFFEECGTGTILRIKDMPLPDTIEYDRGYGYYRFLINHAYIADKMMQQGRPLTRLAYPGAVYVIHGQNFYAKRNRPRPWLWLFDECKNVLMRCRITNRLIREFGQFEM